MILVAGGTGKLGTLVVGRLAGRGLDVRVLTRERAPTKQFGSVRIQTVEGDARDGRAVERATAGVRTVVSAIHGFTSAAGPYAVDWLANRQLIHAAQAAGVVAHTFETVTGKTGKKSRVPLAMMKLLSVAQRPVQPAVARQIQAGVIMDTCDMTCDASDSQRRYPAVMPTSLADMIRRDYLGDGARQSGSQAIEP